MGVILNFLTTGKSWDAPPSTLPPQQKNEFNNLLTLTQLDYQPPETETQFKGTFKGTSFCFNSLASSSLKLRRSCSRKSSGQYPVWFNPWDDVYLPAWIVDSYGRLVGKYTSPVDPMGIKHHGKTHSMHPQKHPIVMLCYCFFFVNFRISNWCLLRYLTLENTQGCSKDAWIIWIETAWT